MHFNEITTKYHIKIIDNKLNNDLMNELNQTLKNKLMSHLTINAVSSKINYSVHKIKQVENAAYQNLKIFEYKISLDKNIDVRMAFSVDDSKLIIYIVGLIIISDKIRKQKFDQIISNMYHK